MNEVKLKISRSDFLAIFDECLTQLDEKEGYLSRIIETLQGLRRQIVE